MINGFELSNDLLGHSNTETHLETDVALRGGQKNL